MDELFTDSVNLQRIAEATERIASAVERMATPEEAQTCTHPTDEREDLGSTMGHPRYRCKACGHEEGSAE